MKNNLKAVKTFSFEDLKEKMIIKLKTKEQLKGQMKEDSLIKASKFLGNTYEIDLLSSFSSEFLIKDKNNKIPYIWWNIRCIDTIYIDKGD